MSVKPLGHLVPVGGGDSIPLLRSTMTLGRRESCDVCLHFPAVSGKHCELTFEGGVWSVTDLNSTNGTKVNGERVTRRPLRPGDELTVGKHRCYHIRYPLSAAAREKLEAMMGNFEDMFANQSLLEKAGLVTAPKKKVRPDPDSELDDDDTDTDTDDEDD